MSGIRYIRYRTFRRFSDSLDWLAAVLSSYLSNCNSSHENAFENVVCEMAAILPKGRWVLNTKSSASRRHQFRLQYVPRLSELKYWSHVCLDVCVQQSSGHLLVIVIHQITKPGCVKTVQASCDTDHILGSIYPSFSTIHTLRRQKNESCMIKQNQLLSCRTTN